MIVENKRLEKLCCFYVSEFHLEMILLPYINKSLDENKKIFIVSEINLEKSLGILMSKINLKENRKNEILNLNWKNNSIRNIENNSVIIIVGKSKFIKNINEQLKIENSVIVDCYNFEEIQDKSTEILNGYEKNLNTSGIQDI